MWIQSGTMNPGLIEHSHRFIDARAKYSKPLELKISAPCERACLPAKE